MPARGSRKAGAAQMHRSGGERLTSLEPLYKEELRDLYGAERQIVKELPRMIKGASSPQLQTALEEHLDEALEHARRLERIFGEMGMPATAGTSRGMAGMLHEGTERLRSDGEPSVHDASIIAAAQRMDHYMIAGYGTARAFASHLGRSRDTQLLEQACEEEKQADRRLTEIAEDCVNVEATAPDGERHGSRTRRRYAAMESERDAEMEGDIAGLSDVSDRET